MRISYSAFENNSQCSKLIVTFSLRRNGNFICENLRIQTYYPPSILTKMYLQLYLILIDILHKKLLKVLLSESFQHA